MTGLKANFHARQGWQRFLPAVAVVCLVLLTLLAVAQSTHIHQNQTDADHCQLCIVMHSAAPIAALAVVVEIVRLGIFVPRAEPISVVRLHQTQLFIRPPPSSC